MRTYGRLWLEDGSWHIDVEPHVALRMKRVFSKLNRQVVGVLRLENTPENCRDLEWFCERYPLSIRDAGALATGSRKHRDTIARLEDLIDPSYTPKPLSLAIPARDYQRRAAEIYLTQGFLLLADDVGIGKTASAICSFIDERTLPAIVVTLSGTMPWQWADEIRRFAPGLETHVLKKGTPYELPKFFGRGPDIVVLNYHKLAGWAAVLAKYGRSVIFDECQELRRKGSGFQKSQKYAAAEHVASQMSFRLGLSATPIYNYGGEIHNVVSVLKPGVLGSRQEFETEWCAGYSVDSDKARIKNPKAFGTYLREQFIMLRRTRADVGRELPEVTRIPQRVGADARKLDEVKGSAAELAKIILSDTANREERLFASGELSYKLRQATGIAKAPYVADFVRLLIDSGESVVVAGWHREVYSLWLEKLKDHAPAMFTGSESPAQKRQELKRFLERDTDVLLMSLRAGAGLDGLQKRCRTVVFGELDWSPGIHEQFIGRIHRDGQPDPVTAYFLVADSGSDPVIAETLGIKRGQIEGIRNPDHDLFEKLDVSGSRARALAEHFLNANRHLKDGAA